jgi:signal transduction histidine kinase
VAHLKAGFNAMVDGLREREERLEEARGETSRLERELAVSKATSDLAAQVAHDIRSPLAAMGAAARGLQLPGEQRELLENSARRIQDIADDLLRRYRSPSAARAEEKPRPCLLAGLIEKTLAEKRLQYKDKAGVNIVFAVAAGEARASVNPGDLQRLLSNLVNNSVEAFGQHGTLTLTLSSRDGEVFLEVKDDGRGIPPEILPKLGLKGSTHGKAGGTGLGLYHARVSVENWGGRLEIESEPGAGTTVTIALPAVPGRAVRFAALLDDDPLVHLNWKLAAKAAGAELKAFKNPEDFYSAAGSLPKDSPIYIDSELGGEVKGEDIAKDLREKGFTDLTLATGHAPAGFSHLPWLKVTGKEPPFGV